MLSLETARKLKEAGLKWEPKEGDFFTIYYAHTDIYEKGIYLCHDDYFGDDEDIWLPRLDQLLAEIEKRGYWWEVNYSVVSGGENEYKTIIDKKHDTSILRQLFTEDTPEEAAAQALLWILEKEAKV